MPRTPRLTTPELEQILAELTAIVAELARHATRSTVTVAEQARVRAEQYSPGVSATVTGAGNGRSVGTVSDPTGEAVIRAEKLTRPTDGTEPRHAGWHADPTEWWPTQLAVAARATVTIAGRLADVVTAINAHAAPIIDDRTGRRTDTLGAGLCRACDHHAPGTATDRLRGGLCDPCRKRWERTTTEYIDRAEYVRNWRHANGLAPLHPDTEHNRTDPT